MHKAESDSVVGCTPRSFLKILISGWNLNRIRKYFILFIRGPDKQAEVFSNSVSISQRYSITKFEKIDFESLIRLFLAERDNEKEAFKDGRKYKTEKKTGRLPLQTFYYLNRILPQKRQPRNFNCRRASKTWLELCRPEHSFTYQCRSKSSFIFQCLSRCAASMCDNPTNRVFQISRWRAQKTISVCGSPLKNLNFTHSFTENKAKYSKTNVEHFLLCSIAMRNLK